MNVEQLNFHHLRYFWAVAHAGSLTRAASRLRVAPSALSSQIGQLEDQLGVPLFEREGRQLALTEAGRVALVYANAIFDAGGELLGTFARGRGDDEVLRIGAVATLSRNFQESVVRPLLERPGVRLQLVSGGSAELVARLEAHALDVVLTNRPPPERPGLRCQRLAEQRVSVVGAAPPAGFRFPADIHGAPMIVPGPDSDVRLRFDAICAEAGLRPRLLAEVDDMATMRLLARDTGALALLPAVVVRDELHAGRLHEYAVVPDLVEAFYAVTVERRFPHPLVASVLERDAAELLRAEPSSSSGRG